YPRCDHVGPPVALPDNKAGPNDTGCLADIANALGSSKGFVPPPTDHAGAATAAIVLVRDGRGDIFAHVDAWLFDVKSGKGVGHDALRLAMARKMVEGAPIVGRKIEDEAGARAAIQAVASAIPGACPTYWVFGSNEGAKTLPIELDAEHSACVQRD